MQKILVRLVPVAAAVAAIHCGSSGGKVDRASPSPASKSSVPLAPHHHSRRTPQHLPGGDTFPLPWSTTTPPQTTLLNSFFPGPPPLFDGEWAEPSTIIDFAGAVAQVYLGGTASDSIGKKYFVEVDTRAFQGLYVGTDGKVAFGTFCEI